MSRFPCNGSSVWGIAATAFAWLPALAWADTPPAAQTGRNAQTAAPPAVAAQTEDARLLAQARQLVVVRSATWDSPRGTLQRWGRRSEKDAWQPVGPPIAVWLGGAGMAWRSDRADGDHGTGPRKVEGDGRSPAGLFRLGDVWGYAATAPAGMDRPYSLPYHASEERDRCVDDVASPHYNRMAQAPAVDGRSSRVTAADEPWRSAERLRLTTDHYKLLLVVDYNAAIPSGVPGDAIPSAARPTTPNGTIGTTHDRRPRPGAGSCIFVHVAPPPGGTTAGCTALAEADLRTLLRWLRRDAGPLLLQIPMPAAGVALQQWALPAALGSDRATGH